MYEIQLNRKKYFFTVIYRSPSQDQSEFDSFTINFELTLSKMHAENPFCVIITGDFNCRSARWWKDDIENNEGKHFESLTSDLGLHQLISEPTHFMGDSKSCIDLIFTDQPNLVVESGVHPSLHEQCRNILFADRMSLGVLGQGQRDFNLASIPVVCLIGMINVQRLDLHQPLQSLRKSYCPKSAPLLSLSLGFMTQ